MNSRHHRMHQFTKQEVDWIYIEVLGFEVRTGSPVTPFHF